MLDNSTKPLQEEVAVTIAAFNASIDIWINALKHYSEAGLLIKPSEESWSIGQVYMHLLSQSTYYLSCIKECILNNDHKDEKMSPAGKKMFERNGFPDELIEGPPDNAFTPQPQSKEDLMARLQDLKAAFNELVPAMSTSVKQGKTLHPGLKYFNAREWMKFAEMHFRHHLRQKNRIDAFLSRSGPQN